MNHYFDEAFPFTTMQRLLKDHYHHYLNRLSQALLDCPTLRDRDTRNALLGELPERIRTRLNSHIPQPRMIVKNLVATCANYEEGETELFRVLNSYEDNSLTYQTARQIWHGIKREIDELDRLINWVQTSSIPLDELRQIFVAVTPEEYAAKPASAEKLVIDLWEVSGGHLPLLEFIQNLQVHPELSDHVRQALQEWCAAAPSSTILKLHGDKIVSPHNTAEISLLITIEPGKEDPSMRLVKLWLDENGKLEMLFESARIPVNQLDQRVSEEIDIATAIYPQTRNIIFYLPKALLNMPVDSWEMYLGNLQQRFIERYRVTKGILERQEILAIRKDMESARSKEEIRRLVLTARNNPLLWGLLHRIDDWKQQWHRLNNVDGCMFIDVTQILTANDQLPPAKPFALLTFTPANLASIELDDPIGQLMIAGIPLIAWVRSVDKNLEAEAHLRHTLYDVHCDYVIHTARHIVDLLHEICRHAPDPTDLYQIGHNLNLIVDNPENKLPYISRELL